MIVQRKRHYAQQPLRVNTMSPEIGTSGVEHRFCLERKFRLVIAGKKNAA